MKYLLIALILTGCGFSAQVEREEADLRTWFAKCQKKCSPYLAGGRSDPADRRRLECFCDKTKEIK